VSIKNFSLKNEALTFLCIPVPQYNFAIHIIPGARLRYFLLSTGNTLSGFDVTSSKFCCALLPVSGWIWNCLGILLVLGMLAALRGLFPNHYLPVCSYNLYDVSESTDRHP